MSVSVSQRESENFHTLKAGAIVVVVFGHFFQPIFPLVWVPVAFALLVFAYASAYFTSRIYGERVEAGPYWRRKFERLGLSLLVVDVFLLVLFLWQGRSGLLTWQTAVNLVGLQGLLEWFGLPNPSPFGGGMWFFTLLLVFYAVYPFLARVYRNRGAAVGTTLLLVVLAWGLQQILPFGHALWLTSCGFILGLLAGRFPIQVPRKMSLAGLALVVMAALAANGFGVKQLNFFFFLTIFLPAIALLQQRDLPVWLHQGLRPLRGCLLEIYLVHSQLAVHATSIGAVDFLGSLVLTVGVAKLLEWLSRWGRWLVWAEAA